MTAKTAAVLLVWGEPTQCASLEEAKALAAYYDGIAFGYERAKELVTQVLDARARELPAEAFSMAFTRDRLRAALFEAEEIAAVAREKTMAEIDR